MAKGIGLIGNVSGKLGNTVGYSIKNSKTKETQGWRIYQPKVKNPQSDAQMAQRVKMTAINNLYRALRDVIARGMEGVQYGDPSRREWLKMAMSRNFRGPYLAKGDKTPAPLLGIPVMSGSLAPVPVVGTADGVAIKFASSSADDISTIAGMTEIFLRNGYQVGDQVTIVMCYDFNGTVRYDVIDFVLDLANANAPLGDRFEFTGLGNTSILIDDANGYTTGILAGAVSVSRDGDGSHLRSTAEFALTPAAATRFYSVVDYDSIIASYINSNNRTTDWEQVPTRGSGGETATSATARLRNGDTVSITGYREVGGYIVFLDANGNPTYYAYMMTDTVSSFRQYIAAGPRWSVTAPADATEANTIGLQLSGDSATDVDRAFIQWMLNNGFTYQFIFAL